ncbi:MAG: type II toxin-antitoxin system RelE/ParE family toxin [Caulobacteraceae bacterium]|nr:type II toxin-antitoxin system RelE/ParE family toxin [Caulobacter sp.]
MLIRSISHKGLRRLVEEDDRRGLDAQIAPKLRRMLSFLEDATDVKALESVPVWRAHQLTGDLRGVWSLSVTRNWRLTFRLDEDGAVIDLDLEDYH